MAARKWIKIWLLFALVVGFTGVFNFGFDSLGIFTKSGSLDKAARAVASGKIIAGMYDFDERDFRRKTIENLPYEPSWVAIGSSRTLMLSKDILREKIVVAGGGATLS